MASGVILVHLEGDKMTRGGHFLKKIKEAAVAILTGKRGGPPFF
jgi:hypothetical protein